MQKKYHLIAIGGSVMHNLALDLHHLGHIVTGSDDEIYEPSRSRLAQKALLPDKFGWDPNRITTDIDAIILGKHARIDNPELLRAQELDLEIYSFPEFMAKHSLAKTTVCIAGSHGKTSTTAMIMHVLKQEGIDFDYLVGAQLEGFDKMVRMSGAPILVTEGDEYPSSALDNRAKMIHYKADIAVITGLAWDHVNIYKTYESYKNAFREFLNSMSKNAVCYFDCSDADLNTLMINEGFPPERISYKAFAVNKKGSVEYQDELYQMKIFGRHNMLNLSAAYQVCQRLGIDKKVFFESMGSFKGAAKRLELISEDPLVYRDFAHAPSKCMATVEAVKNRYPSKKLKAVLELHTFSSLDKSFLKQYAGAMDKADVAYVYFDKHALSMKKMPDLDPEDVYSAFSKEDLTVTTESKELEKIILNSKTDGTEVLLVMSSGVLGGLKLSELFD